jgi:hypothetical protein
VIGDDPSGLLPLAAAGCSAAPACQSCAHIQTSPRQTCVWGVRRRPSGRLSRRSCFRPIPTPSSRACGYKTASGRLQWPNPDPIGEVGGENLFSFLANSPLWYVDTLGLRYYAGPQDNGDDNTVVCDGNDGLKVQISRKNPPTTSQCVLDCIRKHEEKHIEQYKIRLPNLCRGKKPNASILNRDEKELALDELAPHRVELECLSNAKITCSHGCSDIDVRIKEMQDSLKDQRRKTGITAIP